MFKPGSIRKVEVRNFVTYSHVEIYPGPHLNMIIGPNGTGKSTMVAAIILGLGGNPKVVGRGTKVSEYVKHNCDSAMIQVYLQENKENTYTKVTREFDTQERNNWKLNDRRVKLENILEYIKKFNIQVNNLCQFLPQDRVQDFAKLNNKELLKETQRALCRFDLIDKQEMLIKSRENHKKLQESIDKNCHTLQQAEEANVRLEGRVQSFNTKKKYDEIVQNIERKIAWITYEDIRGQVSEIKKDRNKAQQIYDKYKSAVKPIEDEITVMKKKITELQQINSKSTQLIRNVESSINTYLEKIESLKGSLRKLDDDMNTKLAEIQQWDKEIENALKKLEDMKKLQKEVRVKFDAINKEHQTLSTEVTKLLGHQKILKDKNEEILQSKQDDIIKIRALEHELSRLENVKQNRLNHLERIDQDAFKAVNWLRNNKHLFEGEIFEPIMLEVNVLDNRQAKYVENVIPIRDRLAFTCVNKNDMNKLIRCLREKQNLSVNVIHSGNSSASQCRPTIPIERLRKYGFYTYINNLFTAPEPIMCYLCKTYNIHNIPLGDQTTNDYYEQLPPQIRHFFSDKYRYSISSSKYSGQKSTRQVEVRSDGGLSYSLDIIRLDKLKGQIKEIQSNIQNYNIQNQTFETQMTKVNENVSALRQKLQEIQQQKQHVKAVDGRIQTTQNKIKEMQQCKKSPDVIRAETEKKAKIVVQSLYNLQESIKNEYKKLCELIEKNTLITMKIEVTRKKVAYAENVMKEKSRQCQEAEEQMNLIKDKYADVMNQAKSILMKAKSLSKGCTPADEGFNEFKADYDALSSNLQELTSKKELYLSRIACLNIADNAEIREYEERNEQINQLKEEIEKSNTDLNRAVTRMNRLQEEWLTPLNTLIADINLKFATAFERMGCAGEVSICSGDNDKDFSEYGIRIKVTYRNGEPLQELNSNIQSGGERAVATAAYMLSLQELTPVPFRCVDEINQGMDANNERRIFELIVDCTCQPTSSQYFLITPKLLPHLNYSENMSVHIVHNGPFVAQDKKWGFSKLCNPDNVQIA